MLRVLGSNRGVWAVVRVGKSGLIGHVGQQGAVTPVLVVLVLQQSLGEGGTAVLMGGDGKM